MAECLRILVAEDLPDDAELLKLAFRRAGVKVPVDYVRDGAEAIDYLRGEALSNGEHPGPTMLLLDLKMPRLDGFGVLEWLRRQPGLRRLLVVVFTSSAEQNAVHRAFELGANSYVVKPVGFPALKEMVGKLESYWLNVNLFPDFEPERLRFVTTRVLLRNTRTGQYVQGGGRWTDCAEDALDFGRSEQAILSAMGMRSQDLEIVAEVGEESFKIKLRIPASA